MANTKVKKEKKDTKHEELENQLRRTLADYQNLERRVSEERQLLGKLSTALFIEKMLPVLDNVENAQKHLNDPGLELVLKQFKEVLATEGVEEIKAEGQEFDPNLHEAIEAESGEIDNKVTKVVAKGYKIEDKVIRPSRVVVSKKNETNNKQNEGEQINV